MRHWTFSLAITSLFVLGILGCCFPVPEARDTKDRASRGAKRAPSAKRTKSSKRAPRTTRPRSSGSGQKVAKGTRTFTHWLTGQSWGVGKSTLYPGKVIGRCGVNNRDILSKHDEHKKPQCWSPAETYLDVGAPRPGTVRVGQKLLFPQLDTDGKNTGNWFRSTVKAVQGSTIHYRYVTYRKNSNWKIPITATRQLVPAGK